MDAVAEIRRRIDLAEYIGRFVKLQRSGRSFKAVCPFHSEKTPSFYVFPEHQHWRCFGSCGEGGDLFSFVQKRENLDFRGALKLLAAEAGVELTPGSNVRRGHLEQLAAVVSAAVDYFQRCFLEPRATEARDYVFDKRSLTSAAVDAFRIGWAPDEWRGLRDHLASRGYDERIAVAAGLLVEPESGGAPYDRFRGRVTIPIADERGQYIGIGGRSIHGEEPKYLNSPQTELFDKGRTLFGLHLSAPEIRRSGTAVVVEGYMDVIGPWQAGFTNVVATMGTALTEHHVALLRRSARRIVLALDPDAAGMAAAERAGGLLLAASTPDEAAGTAQSLRRATGGEVDLRVAPLPEGFDPDEVARDDPDGWRRAVEQARPFAEFLVMRLLANLDSDSPLDARRAVDRIRPVLLTVPDPVERALYVQRVARHLDIPETSIMERLRLPRRGATPFPKQESSPAARVQGHEPALLALLLQHETVLHASFSSLPTHLFTHAIDREVFRRWADAAQPAEAEDPIEVRRRELLAFRLPPLTPEQAHRAVNQNIQAITRDRAIQHQVTLSELVAEAEAELGANAVASVSLEAWLGRLPPPQQRDLAETMIEDLELGLSIHRREDLARL